MKKTSAYVAAAVATLAIGLGGYLALVGKTPPQSTPRLAYTVLNGQTLRTDDWLGKVVLVNFWATSCAVCVKEMPALAATQSKFGARGYDTLAVAMSYDAPANVVHFAQTRKLPFDVAIDLGGHIERGFAPVHGTPTSVLINRRGEVVKRYIGAPDFRELHALIEGLLAET